MTNLFESFTITVSGAFLDDKKFYEYSDYSFDPATAPTDAEVLTKTQCFLRFQQLKRNLSTYAVPVYDKYKFTTAGTAKTVPSTLTMVVSFKNLTDLASAKPTPTDDGQYVVLATEVLKELVEKSMQEKIEMFGEVQYSYERPMYADPAAPNGDYITTVTDKVTFDTTAATVTVVYNNLP